MTGTHHRQVGEGLWEVNSRDEVRHVDFQRGIRRWTSKGDNIRETSAAKWLKRDKIMEIRWFGSGLCK